MSREDALWLSLEPAAKFIAKELGLSEGGAQAALFEACGATEIRYRSSDPFTHPPERRDWSDVRIDYSGDILIGRHLIPYGGLIIQVQAEDLLFWVRQRRSEATAPEKKPLRRRRATTDRVRDQMLREMESGDPKRDPRRTKQTALPGLYGVKSRTTCKKALDAALSLFVARQSATNDS